MTYPYISRVEDPVVGETRLTLYLPYAWVLTSEEPVVAILLWFARLYAEALEARRGVKEQG